MLFSEMYILQIVVVGMTKMYETSPYKIIGKDAKVASTSRAIRALVKIV